MCVHGALVVEQRLKRHISKSCAISVAIATYLYVTQAANGHLSFHCGRPKNMYLSFVCISELRCLEYLKHFRQSTSEYFHYGS
jgi:hypothetical protein